jgi:hypothetical protein
MKGGADGMRPPLPSLPRQNQQPPPPSSTSPILLDASLSEEIDLLTKSTDNDKKIINTFLSLFDDKDEKLVRTFVESLDIDNTVRVYKQYKPFSYHIFCIFQDAYLQIFTKEKGIQQSQIILEDALKQIISLIHNLNDNYDFTSKEYYNNLLNFLQILFPRFFEDSNLKNAIKHTIDNEYRDIKPWVVVIMGLNGIRKTTAMKDDQIKTLIYEALPKKIQDYYDKDFMPSANNSFFRQLDFIVPSLASKFFEMLKDLNSIDLYKLGKHKIFSTYGLFFGNWLNIISNCIGSVGCNMLIEATGQNYLQSHLINRNEKFSAYNKYNKLIIRFSITEDNLSIIGDTIDKRFEEEFANLKKSKSLYDITKAIIGGSTTTKVYTYNKLKTSSYKTVFEASNKARDLLYIKDTSKLDTINATKEQWTNANNESKGWYKLLMSITPGRSQWNVQVTDMLDEDNNPTNLGEKDKLSFNIVNKYTS